MTGAGQPLPSGGITWQRALTLIGAGCLAIGLLGYQAVGLAAVQWFQNNAYTYCLLIPVISGWLLWERRDEILAQTPQPQWAWLGLLLGAAAMYAVGWQLDINEGKQFALVAAMQVVFLAVLGFRLYWRLAFPLNYLWLIVPTGTFLIPTMQDWSTYFSVALLRLVEIPVISEGWLIEVPTGRYLVAEGCAGLNFLLVAVALSTLFAYLTYRTWTARILCVVISLVVAIVSNWVRVFGIIYIAHLTDSQAEIVEDHLLYGWFYFAAIMFGLMSLGLRLKPREDLPA